MYLQISKETQAKLKELKGDETYEQLLVQLLKFHDQHDDKIHQLVRQYLVQYKK